MPSGAWRRRDPALVPAAPAGASVRLPWALGLVALLGLAAATGIVGGRVDSGVVVPTAVLDAQQASTDSAAQQVRRSVNAGLDDLDQLGSNLALADRPGDLAAHLKDFGNRFHRYRSVYLVDNTRKVVARGGTGGTHPDAVPARPRSHGLTNAAKIDSVPVVVLYTRAFREAKRL